MSSPVKVLLLSSTRFGYRCLTEGILKVPSVELKGIITTPQTIRFGKKGEPLSVATPADFHQVGESYQCPVIVYDKESTTQKLSDIVSEISPDLILVLGWYHIIKKSVLSLPPLGTVAIHASMLPRYRGMAPINWAIINGETETGVTLFYLDAGMDSGDIIAQSPIAINITDTCSSLYDRVTDVSIKLLKDYLPRVADGSAPRTKQNEKQATYYPRRIPEDGLIDWTKDCKTIYDFVRAQTKPYPGAFTVINGRKLYIWEVAMESSAALTGSDKAGAFMQGERKVTVQTGNGRIRLKRVQWEDEEESGDPIHRLGDIIQIR